MLPAMSRPTLTDETLTQLHHIAYRLRYGARRVVLAHDDRGDRRNSSCGAGNTCFGARCTRNHGLTRASTTHQQAVVDLDHHAALMIALTTLPVRITVASEVHGCKPIVMVNHR
eukprot:5323248-Amphidinium_carterae.2